MRTEFDYQRELELLPDRKAFEAEVTISIENDVYRFDLDTQVGESTSNESLEVLDFEYPENGTIVVIFRISYDEQTGTDCCDIRRTVGSFLKTFKMVIDVETGVGELAHTKTSDEPVDRYVDEF